MTKRGKVTCNQCGYQCGCYFFHDVECSDAHQWYHQQWESLPKVPDYLPQNVKPFSRVKHCPWCENKLGIYISHKCDRESKSVDWLDVMRKLK